jgi:hypothetical protein
MEMPIKETGLMIRLTEKENIFTLMVPNTLETGLKILNKDMELKLGQMVLNIVDPI